MIINRIAKLATAAALLASLVACASPAVIAPAGNYTVAGSYGVKFDRDWSDLTKATFYQAGRAPKVRALTIDGILLNRLYISEGLTPADPLTLPAGGDTKASPALRGKAGMSLSEQMEFVAHSVGQLDYRKVETQNPQPVTIGGVKGVRFELTANTAEGLHIKGLAQAVAKDGQNYYIIYLAPEEHYYAASLPSVIAIMDSGTLP